MKTPINHGQFFASCTIHCRHNPEKPISTLIIITRRHFIKLQPRVGKKTKDRTRFSINNLQKIACFFYLFNRPFDSDVQALLFLKVTLFRLFRFRNFGFRKNCLIFNMNFLPANEKK